MNRRRFLEFAGAASLAARYSVFGATPRAISSLAPKPPLGWNSFNSYGVYLPEEAAARNIDAMAAKLKPFGYEYFVIDNGWFGEYKLRPGTQYAAEKHASDLRINEFGLLQPSKTYFPHGFAPLIERAHGRGLKFGVHLMRGIPRKAVELNTPIEGTKYRARDIANTSSICTWCHYNYGVDMRKPGAQAFYNSLVNQLAKWGVDFIKADDIVPYPEEVIGIANAISQCGREMVFSLSPGGKAPLRDLPYFRRGNMLRITADIWDRRQDLDRAFEAWKRFSGTALPGFWPDLDMIPFGELMLMSPPDNGAGDGGAKLAGVGSKRHCKLTKEQHYTFITMRALAASPLFVGGDLPTMDEFSLSLLTNRDMLACDQNGVMGVNCYAKDGVEVWIAAERDQPGYGWLGVFNRNEAAKTVALGTGELGLDRSAYELRDIWAGGTRHIEGKALDLQIGADSVAFLRFSRKS